MLNLQYNYINHLGTPLAMLKQKVGEGVYYVRYGIKDEKNWLH